MKISVGSRAGKSGTEPTRLCLGRSCLPVTTVLDIHDEGSGRAFEVRVLDGRRFIVRYRSEVDEWELVAVHDRWAVRTIAYAASDASLMPLLRNLCRKGIEVATRKRHWKTAPISLRNPHPQHLPVR